MVDKKTRKTENSGVYWEISDDTCFSITYVDEIRPVLARHAKPKVSPESGFPPHYLRQKEGQEISLLHPDHICLNSFK